jgi:hypothetical protein
MQQGSVVPFWHYESAKQNGTGKVNSLVNMRMMKMWLLQARFEESVQEMFEGALRGRSTSKLAQRAYRAGGLIERINDVASPLKTMAPNGE